MAERGVPQALDVEHFAQARIQEIEFLDAAVAAVSDEGAGGGGSGGGVGGDGGPSSTTAGGLRDQAQGVPRHMRRRTTSHEPRRMPVALKGKDNAGKRATNNNIRNHNNKEGGGGLDVDARRCRKHRRRPRALLAMHSPHAVWEEEEEEQDREQDGVEVEGAEEEGRADGGARTGNQRHPPRWLETHIWHAKRMHMTEAWRFILPAESNRGPRAAVDAALKHCTLQDTTFLRPLELLGPRRCILGVLSAMTDPLDARATGEQSCVDGFVEARTHLYRVNEFPLGCIAPVSVLWSPSDAVDTDPPASSETSDKVKEGLGEDGQEEDGGSGGGDNDDDARRVWLWVHPAAKEEALREVRKACALEGSPWEGSVRVESVPGGLCRLRVRGVRSHEIVQQVLKTESASTATPPPPAAADAAAAAAAAAVPGDHFEAAARDNAARWRALASSRKYGGGARDGGGGGGDGGGGPRSLPSGSVLAITALDPREHRGSHQRRAATHRIPPAPASPGSTATSDTAGGRTTQRVAGGGGDEHVGGGSVGQQSSTAAAEEWPPRWAAVSPLWDADARAFSAKLAATRPDHVINEARRRKRAQEAWHNDSGSVARAAPKDSGGSRRTGSGGGGGGGAAAAATPVILVSASGVVTTAHGEPEPTAATAELFSGGRGDGGGGGRGGGGSGSGDGGDGWGNQVEKKRRPIAAGWDLILPPGWAPVFFGALVMAGARVISLKDADGLALEAGEARFPADYPDTVAGRRHWDEIGRRSEAAWTRTRPKHRGFKRRPPKAAECGEAIAAAGCGSGHEGAKTGQGRKEQSKPSGAAAKPTVSSSCPSSLLSQFRPDFRSLAAGEGFITGSTGAAAAAAGGGASRGGKGEEREPYAVARGFQYVRAILPGEEEELAAAAAVDEDIDVGPGVLLPSPPPPPLRLAFPTVVELALYSQTLDRRRSTKITQDKGVPKPGAPIYPASAEHHTLWIEGHRGGKPWAGFSLADHPSPSPSPPSSSAGPAAAADATTGADGEGAAGGRPPAKAAAIGATTSGGFSFLRGGGAGRAVCEAVAVRDAFALSAACCRRQGVGRPGRGLGRGRPQRPWALVLVGNEAGGWMRPAVAFAAAS